MDKSKILITGGTGMVGHALQKIIPDATYISSKDYDLTNEHHVKTLMQESSWNVVIHLAAKVGGIIDNMTKQSDYFEENVLMNTNLVKWARQTNVKQFIGVLSTCIYPDIVDSYPMNESVLHLGPPTPTNFSYGYAKRCLAVQIDACNTQYGTKFQYLTPCNMYGPNDKIGSRSHFVSALLNKIKQAEKDGVDYIKLFGTGKPLRQFMHSDDFAKIIKLCIDNNVYESFNVATPENLSINDIATLALEVTNNRHMKIEYDHTKPVGQYRKDVCIDKMYSLFPKIELKSLNQGLKETYDQIS